MVQKDRYRPLSASDENVLTEPCYSPQECMPGRWRHMERTKIRDLAPAHETIYYRAACTKKCHGRNRWSEPWHHWVDRHSTWPQPARKFQKITPGSPFLSKQSHFQGCQHAVVGKLGGALMCGRVLKGHTWLRILQRKESTAFWMLAIDDRPEEKLTPPKKHPALKCQVFIVQQKISHQVSKSVFFVFFFGARC